MHSNCPAARRPLTRGVEHGTALMLFPAAVLIVIMLASLCVDATLTFLGQREIANAAEAAANDAASALNRTSYYDHSAYRLDEQALERIGTEAIAARVDDKVHNLDVRITRTDATHIRVEVTADVALIFTKAIPGMRHSTTVRAVAEAEAQQE